MKRLSILLAAATLLAAIAGCQKEPVGTEKGEMTKAYIEFSLNFADDEMTKAEDYQPDDIDPDTDGNQVPGTSAGTDDEHKVDKAVFYFFNSTTKAFVKSIEVKGAQITSGASDENHIKKTTVPTELETGTYKVYATINQDFTSQLTSKTETDFLALETTFTPVSSVPAAGLPMSSRDKEGTLSCEVTLSSANTFEHPAKVSLYMERSNAKISMKNSKEKYTITNVADITLTDYKVVNLPGNAFLFRQVATFATDMTMSNSSNGSIVYSDDNNAANDIQVRDPQTAVKKVYTGAALPAGVTFVNHVNGSEEYNKMPEGTGMNTIMYCNENVMTTDNQLNTFATAIAFKASITPASGNYYVAEGEAVKAGTYVSGDLWYFDGKFYESITTLAKDNDFTLSETDDYGAFGVKKFAEGVCYYTYYIKHYDNFEPLELGFMEYAIVRNNDYQVTITNITDLGEDTPNVDPVPVEMEESYFQATLLVRPWVVRAQDAVLG